MPAAGAGPDDTLAQRITQDDRVEAAPRWEYKVTTFVATDDLATRQLNELAGDRWEYVGLVGTAKPNTSTAPGHESLVAFRRPKK